MNGQFVGRAVGAASLALGVADILLGRRLGRNVGAGEAMGGRLFQIAGVREVATGVAGLMTPHSEAPLQWRLAGDLFDLAALGYIAAPGNPRRKTALLALGIVAGVTLIDLLAARKLAKVSSSRPKESGVPKQSGGLTERGGEAVAAYGNKLDRIEMGLEEDDRTPLDRPGVQAGTAGTGGENKVQDLLSR